MKATKEEKEKYLDLVHEISPNSNIVKNSSRAFFVGGTICLIAKLF